MISNNRARDRIEARRREKGGYRSSNGSRRAHHSTGPRRSNSTALAVSLLCKRTDGTRAHLPRSTPYRPCSILRRPSAEVAAARRRAEAGAEGNILPSAPDEGHGRLKRVANVPPLPLPVHTLTSWLLVVLGRGRGIVASLLPVLALWGSAVLGLAVLRLAAVRLLPMISWPFCVRVRSRRRSNSLAPSLTIHVRH